MVKDDETSCELPAVVAEYIRLVVRRMGYRRDVRREVAEELAGHFCDAMDDCTDEAEREKRGRELVEEFGDAKALGRLIRRGKKRCRPLWKQAVIRILQSAGILIVLLIVYSGSFFLSKPTIKRDYLAWVNKMVRPEVPDSENAWPLYEAAIELYVEPWDDVAELVGHTGRVEGFYAEQRRVMIEWLDRNEPAWEQFTAATRRPYLWIHYTAGDESVADTMPLFEVILPSYGAMRKLAKLAIWRTRRALVDGDTGRALESCLTIAREGAHLTGKKLLIEQLVGIAISALVHQEIVRMLDTTEIASKELVLFQEELSAIYPRGYPLMDFEFERFFFLDAVQRVFTDGGPGGGHVIPQEAGRLFNRIIDPEEVGMLMAGCLVHARRDATVEKANELYDRINESGRLTPFQRHARGGETVDESLVELSKYRYWLIRELMPALGRASEQAFAGKMAYEATVVIVALKRHRLDRGQYPETLDDLVTAGYIEEAPMDPYGPGALQYRRVDGEFVLYSLGRDFDDDGGIEDADDPWGRRDDPNGDRVFWPVR